MDKKKPAPGVSRDNRLSDDGLQRLRHQLENGAKMSKPVLEQWVKRYGDPACEIILQYYPEFTLSLPGK